ALVPASLPQPKLPAMNIRPSVLLAIFTALTALAFLPASAAPETKPALAHAVGSVVRSGETVAARGFNMSDVRRHLGEPREKLSANVWVYHNFNAGNAQDRADDCDTLLVTFADGRVSNIQLVNDRAEKIFAAQIRAK